MTMVRFPAMPKPGWDTIARACPEATEAIDYFRHMLGDAVVRHGHPFATTFMTRFQSGPCEGQRLFDCVRALDRIHGLDDFVRDLGKKAVCDYRSGEMTLRLSAAWRLAGCELEFVPRNSAKTADLRVKFAERWATVECTALNENKDNAAVIDFAQFSMNWAERVPGRLTGHFHENATIDDLDWAREQLAAFESSTTPKHETLTNRVELTFDPAGQRNFFPFDNLPTSRCNDLSRAIDKIGKKQTQLPTREPTIVVIQVGDVFGLHPIA